jgi:hypothetical protein
MARVGSLLGRVRGLAAAVRTVAALAGLVCLAACATLDGTDPDHPRRTHYVLKQGATMPFPRPLPDETDILVDWHYDNGSVQTVTGFRGWDFDGDGRYEMVEVLTETGATQAAVFDFDGDGRIDRTRDY